MDGKERLYKAIEESARTKKPIHIDLKEGNYLRLLMISDKKFLVEDLLGLDDRKNVCQAVLEAGFEKRSGLILPGLYVAGHNNLDGSASGRTNMIRKENRYQSII